MVEWFQNGQLADIRVSMCDVSWMTCVTEEARNGIADRGHVWLISYTFFRTRAAWGSRRTQRTIAQQTAREKLAWRSAIYSEAFVGRLELQELHCDITIRVSNVTNDRQASTRVAVCTSSKAYSALTHFEMMT